MEDDRWWCELCGKKITPENLGRWPDGPRCGTCGSRRLTQVPAKMVASIKTDAFAEAAKLCRRQAEGYANDGIALARDVALRCANTISARGEEAKS